MAIEVIVVGLGLRGKDWIREVRASREFELVGYVDSDREALATVENLNVPASRCFQDLNEAIDRTGCQAVIVATSADQHVGPCETSLAHNLPVLVEKPFALRLNDARRLVQFSEQQKVPLLVAQNYRYLRSFRAARRIIAEGTLGAVRLIACQYFRPPHDVRSHRHLEHTVLFAVSVHHLDALRYVLGAEVTSVAAESFTQRPNDSPSGASFRAMLSFENGIRASYAATYESSGHEFFERGQEFYARFVGDEGTLHVFHRWLILCKQGSAPRLVNRGPRKVTEEQVILQQFQRAIASGEPSEISGCDNLQTMAVLEACVRSATEQRWINPQELLNGSSE
jgi:predicted dehydrogenase